MSQLLRNWIAEHGEAWLPALVDAYKISAVQADGLVSLKYDQIESPMREPLVQQLRGVVVDLETREIVCRPYDKFWNLGEALADPIDWDTARAQDKLDGSLILLYHHRDTWMVASSGHPTAGGPYGRFGSGHTFATKFWEIFYANGMRLPSRTDCAYFFELCAPDNRIVCRYDEPRIVVHGARWRWSADDTFEDECTREYLEDVAAELHWDIVREHPLRTLEEVQAAVQALNPIEGEGFVVVDDAHRRVKVKSPRYVALHRIRGKTTPAGIVDLWKAGEVEELLAYFPEQAPDILAVTSKLEDACEEAYNAYADNRSAPTRKDFALAIKNKPWSSIAFKLLDNNAGTVEDARRVLRASSDAMALRIVEAAS